jgi:hypothetical protein
MARRHVSIFELCARRAAEVEPTSARRAGTLAGKTSAFIAEWAQMMRETGNDDPTLEEWATWANVSRATSFRRQEDFRRLFVGWRDANGVEHHTPTTLALYVNRALARGKGRKGASAALTTT